MFTVKPVIKFPPLLPKLCMLCVFVSAQTALKVCEIWRSSCNLYLSQQQYNNNTITLWILDLLMWKCLSIITTTEKIYFRVNPGNIKAPSRLNNVIIITIRSGEARWSMEFLSLTEMSGPYIHKGTCTRILWIQTAGTHLGEWEDHKVPGSYIPKWHAIQQPHKQNNIKHNWFT